MSKRDRRQFLRDMLSGSAIVGSSAPLAVFVDSILSTALAQATETVNPRRLISFQQPQAPARWSFDLFLTPYMTDQELSSFDPGNPMIRTRFAASGGHNVDMVYETVRLHGINVPHMWSMDVPKAGGGTRPMADLLPNMLALQGINTTNAGHDISRKFHFLPPGALQSTGAMASDYAQAPLGSLGATANYVHRSKFGKTALLPGLLSGNYLDQLLKPFILATASSRLDPTKAAASSNYQRLNRILDTYAHAVADQSVVSAANKSSAHELMLDGFSDLASVWTDRTNVYKDLISRAMSQSNTYVGFNDYPVGSDPATRDRRYAFNSEGNILKFPDLNEMFTGATTTANLAGYFVVAEYLILNNLSYSVSLALGSLQGLKTGSGMNTDSGFNFDEHNMGAVASLLTNFWYNRAVSACMLELTEQLKAKMVASTGKTYFEETVIELYGEFNRNARADAFGSDHGSEGKSVMYISGAFDGPNVIGVLGRAPANHLAPGSWGLGAVDPVLNKQVTNADMAATLAHLLRVPNPFTTTSPMALLQEDGSVLPVASKTRIIG